MCVVRRRIDANVAVEVDLLLSVDDHILPCIDYAIAQCDKIATDRPDVFLPRLQLAKVRWLMERGEGVRATDVVT